MGVKDEVFTVRCDAFSRIRQILTFCKWLLDWQIRTTGRRLHSAQLDQVDRRDTHTHTQTHTHIHTHAHWAGCMAVRIARTASLQNFREPLKEKQYKTSFQHLFSSKISKHWLLRKKQKSQTARPNETVTRFTFHRYNSDHLETTVVTTHDHQYTAKTCWKSRHFDVRFLANLTPSRYSCRASLSAHRRGQAENPAVTIETTSSKKIYTE